MTSELVTRMTECPFGEGENLLRSDLEDEHFAVEDLFAIAMMKAVDADGVIPTTVPLVRPRFGDANEFLLDFTRFATPSTTTSRPLSQSLRPVVRVT